MAVHWAVPPGLQSLSLKASSLNAPSRWDRAHRHRGNHSRHLGGGQRHHNNKFLRVGGASGLRHAVCVTGLEREYPEISRNIDRAIFGLLNRTSR